MMILQTYRDLDWLPKPNESRLISSSEYPPKKLTTSVLCFVFKKDLLLLTKLSERGWDIPGGHLEQNESVIDALHREIREETKVIIENPLLIGHQKITLLGERPKHYKYPFPTSYQLFFTANMKTAYGFESSNETVARDFFTGDAIRKIETSGAWIDFFEIAIQLKHNPS